MIKNLKNHIRICDIHKTTKKCKLKKDGISYKFICTQCAVERSRAWREKNKDRYKKQNREHYLKRREFIKNNPDLFVERDSEKLCEKHNIKKVFSTDNAIVCRECKKEYASKYRKQNPGKKYNLTKEQFDFLHREENLYCKICKRKDNFGKKFFIDHCHDTGKVRDLLCATCNAGLGSFFHNDAILQSAIEYLQSHQHKEAE